MKLWGSRFEKSTDPKVGQLNASFSFDKRLFNEDIDASQAWARSLARCGLLTKGERQAIQQGLEEVRSEFSQGKFEPEPSDEDIHTAVERRLTEIIGDSAGKLHTGRSRNDQVATDFRLWVMRACQHLRSAIDELAGALLDSAQAHLETPMPGYTHLQPAQPVTWGHWALSHFWPLLRDRQRFTAAQAACSVLPLGSGALSGTAFNIDRQSLAADLGFAAISANSIDAVSDRDFALEFLFAASVLGVHLSRLAEGLILFSSSEFGFVELDEAFATGSSLMPQKKNPDPLELARGKTGRLIGNLVSLLTTLKGLPSAYDKDLQEDKEPLFDSYETLALLLPVLAGLVRSMRLSPENMSSRLTPDMLATDLAEYLVRKGIPFRQAHHLVGLAVRQAQASGRVLDALTLDELQSISPQFEDDVHQVFDMQSAMTRRSVVGGVAPVALAAQLEAARTALAM